VGCIQAACEGIDTIEALKRQLERLFGDIDDGGLPKDAVILGTIHRSKGLEANNVYIVAPHLLPHPLAKQSWELQQECNLATVAATRAKFVIKNSLVVEPGRLYFVGERPAIYSSSSSVVNKH
jgi:superfamily I DNA/RNA helicase